MLFEEENLDQEYQTRSKTPLLDKALGSDWPERFHKSGLHPSVDQKEYDIARHTPQKAYEMVVLERMARIWGKEKIAEYCEMEAFKWLQGSLGLDEPTRSDLDKEQWYLDRAKQLRS